MTNAIPTAGDTAVSVSPAQARERVKVGQAIAAINNSNIFGLDRELTFSLDRTTHQMLLRVIDRDTHQTIMQLPPDYVIRMAEALQKNETAQDIVNSKSAG
jgi:flagellar protein FlaG